MKPHLEARLYDAFPLLYAEHTLPREFYPMDWGCTCGDGWLSLLWDLSCDLNDLIQREPEAVRTNYGAVQVKEKLGGLRFYMHRSTPAMQDCIMRAEAESLRTCDVRGEPGELLRGPGLWRTRCASHPEPILAYS